MSQDNNFLFIFLQMPSCIRIQPMHLLSQKPCGSSQPVLDVTACSCPGRLLARGQPQVWGNPYPALQKTADATCGVGLAPHSPAFFQMPIAGPCQKQALCPLGLALHGHSHFFSYFPLRQCQVLIQCWVTDPSRTHDTVSVLELGSLPPKSWPAQTHCSPTSAPPCCAWQTVRISSCDSSIGTRSWAAHLLQTKQLQLWQSHSYWTTITKRTESAASSSLLHRAVNKPRRNETGQLGLAGGAERAGPELSLQGGPKWGKMEGSPLPGSLSDSLHRTKLLQPLLLLQTSHESTVQFNAQAVKQFMWF